MDSGGGNPKIDKLTESNLHVWEHKVELILAFRRLNLHIGDSAAKPSPSDQAETWLKQDTKAKAIIGLTLSDRHLEHVRDCATADSMWSTITDLFQRKMLLDMLHTRRRSYSTKMVYSEKTMTLISRVHQLAADCKTMYVSIGDQEFAMAVLCALPHKYDHLIVAILAATDDKSLSLDVAKSHLLQEELRLLERNDIKPTVDSGLVNNHVNKQAFGSGDSSVVCSHCGKANHTEPKCWQKYPHLRPTKKVKISRLAAKAPDVGAGDLSGSDSHGVLCLMCKVPSDSFRLASRATWIVDSGATAHIRNDRLVFCDLNTVDAFFNSIGDKSGVKAIGRGSVELLLFVSGEPRKCIILNDVVYVPAMAFNMSICCLSV